MRKMLALSAALAMSAGTAFAVPYASQIRVSNFSVSLGNQVTISYVLNEDADVVTVEIVDSGDNVVASFDAPSGQGAQSVVWDLTDDNDGGTAVDPDDGFRVRITADADRPEEWYEFASNSSAEDAGTMLNSVLPWWRPNDVHIPKNTDRDYFGLVHAITSRGAGDDAHAGALPFRTDLELAGGNQIADLLLVPDNPGLGITQLWGISEDPFDEDALFLTGQSAPALQRAGNAASPSLTDADPAAEVPPNVVRSGVVIDVEGTRYAFYPSTTATANNANFGVYRAEIDANGDVVPDSFENVSTLVDRAIAMVHAATDADGNLYLVARSGIESANFGGQVIRWSNATLAAIDIGDTTTLLSLDTADNPDDPAADNADWNLLDFPGAPGEEGAPIAGDNPGFQDRRYLGLTVAPDGEVYALSRRYIISLGNSSQAENRGQVDPAQRIVDLAPRDDVGEIVEGDPSLLSTDTSNITADGFGNLYVADSNNAYIRAFAPGGESSTTVTAPSSQLFNINPEPTNARLWHLYE